MHLFFIREIDGNRGYLDAEETAHCIRVLRKSEGDTLFGIDGKGGYYECVIIQKAKNSVTLEIKSRIEGFGEKPEGRIILAVSPLKQKERFEWLIEKSVELGVDEIYPIICRYTITDNIKPERLLSIIQSAAKQCKRAKFPVLHHAHLFAAFLKTKNLPDLGLIAYCEASKHLNHFGPEIEKQKEALLLVGPEGDFHAHEVEAAESVGFHTVLLGESRLRTETAGLFGLSLLKGYIGY